MHLVIAMVACSEVMRLSDVFADGELFTELQARMIDHLRGCNDCAAVIKDKLGLKRLIHASVRNLTAPAGLRQRLRLAWSSGE